VASPLAAMVGDQYNPHCTKDAVQVCKIKVDVVRFEKKVREGSFVIYGEAKQPRLDLCTKKKVESLARKKQRLTKAKALRASGWPW